MFGEGGARVEDPFPQIIGFDTSGCLVALVCEQPDGGRHDRVGRVVARLGGVGVVGSYDEEPGLRNWRYLVGDDRLIPNCPDF